MSPGLRRAFQIASLALAFAVTSSGASTTTNGQQKVKDPQQQRKPVVGEALLKAKQEIDEQQRKLGGVEVGWENAGKNGNNGNKGNKPNAGGGNTISTNGKATIKVMFQYSGEIAQLEKDVRDILKTKTKSKNMKALKIGAVEVTSEELEVLMASENIVQIDMDHPVEIDLYETHDDEDVGGSLRGGGRQLAESVPYGLAMVQADEYFPPLPSGYKPIKVCVVDTGYDNTHSDLPVLDTGSDGFTPAGLLNPSDGTASQYWYVDGHSHGTHVAGTIGAIGGNNRGVNSVLSYANDEHDQTFSLWIGKGLSDSGSGSMSDVLDSVEKCLEAAKAENTHAVVNLSLGYKGSPSTVDTYAYNRLFDEGVLMVAAAGNANDNLAHYPASYSSMMAVAAVDSSKNLAWFSSFHDQVEIAAPGVSIKSTVPGGGTSNKSGTSMASPHVAAVAALVWGHFPQCTNLQIRNVLLMTAERTQGGTCDSQYGYGIVQAKNAYDLLASQGCEAGSKHHAVHQHVLAKGGCEQHPWCNDGVLVETIVDLDSYPSETSQMLKKGDNVIIDIPEGSYTRQRETEVEVACVTDGAYEYQIKDAWGDGNCCSYGPGAYSVAVAGEIVHSRSGDFGSGDTFTFTVSTADDDSTAPPTASPTKSPTASPTASPTKSPTASPTEPPTTSPPESTPSPTASPTAPPTTSPPESTPSPTASPTAPPSTSPPESTIICSELYSKGACNGYPNDCVWSGNPNSGSCGPLSTGGGGGDDGSGGGGGGGGCTLLQRNEWCNVDADCCSANCKNNGKCA